jgi:hypothetical protein
MHIGREAVLPAMRGRRSDERRKAETHDHKFARLARLQGCALPPAACRRRARERRSGSIALRSRNDSPARGPLEMTAATLRSHREVAVSSIGDLRASVGRYRSPTDPGAIEREHRASRLDERQHCRGRRVTAAPAPAAPKSAGARIATPSP